MNLLQIMLMIWNIESGGRYNPPNNGCHVGPMQIAPIMVEECNRIVGSEVYTLEDRRDFIKSLSMCSTFLRYQRKRWRSSRGTEVPVDRLMESWESGSVYRRATPLYQERVAQQLERYGG